MLLLIISNYLFSQNQEVELFLNDGTFLEGYGMIYKKDKIKFRLSLDKEPDIWTSSLVKGIMFYDFQMDTKFEYLVLKPDDQPKLLLLVREGRLNLYSESRSRTISFGLEKITDFENTVFYIKKSSDKYPVRLNGNFKKRSKKYLSDCVEIIEKLNNGDYGIFNANEMVVYYNDNCAK